MRILGRLVVDNNVFASAIIFPRSAPRQLVDDALDQGVVLFSEATMSELADVLARSKFDRYVRRRERELVLAQIGSAAEFYPSSAWCAMPRPEGRQVPGACAERQGRRHHYWRC